MALDEYRDKIKPLRSNTSGTKPDPTEMEPGEFFVNSADRLVAIREESTEVLKEIAGFETEYRDLIQQNKVFLPLSGNIDNITYNTTPTIITGETTININDTSPSVINITNVKSNLTINVSGIDDVTNKIIRLVIDKSKDEIEDDFIITWNGINQWLSNSNSVPKFGSKVNGTGDDTLFVVIAIFDDEAIANTLYNDEDPVSSDSIATSSYYSMLPIGSICYFVATEAPSGWLLCDGSEININDYTSLCRVLGTTYGTSERVGNYVLPNLIDISDNKTINTFLPCIKCYDTTQVYSKITLFDLDVNGDVVLCATTENY